MSGVLPSPGLAARSCGPAITPVPGERVSVLVPTFNRAQFLPMALDSLLGQTRPPDEILVINDGSTDGTTELLSRYQGRVRVLERSNGGKSAALNTGLEQATGDLCWFFDDDDVALPDTLERHLQALATDPGAGFTMSPGLQGHTVGPSLAIQPFPVQPVAPPFDAHSLLAYLVVMSLSPFHLQGALIRRACVDAAGRFDPDLLRSQDYGFLVQLARRCRMVKSTAPTYLHRHGSHERGPSGLRHPPLDRQRHWVHFGRLLWRKCQDGFDLMDHLPRRPGGAPQPATPENVRDARVARCAALLYKGLWPELLDLLPTAFEGFPPGTACGRFSAELWMNALQRLRVPLWEELREGPVWATLAAALQRPATAHLGGLSSLALQHALGRALPDSPPALLRQIEAMRRDLEGAGAVRA